MAVISSSSPRPQDPPPGPLPSGTDREGLVAEVTRALEVLPRGAGAIVALSGGPDSTALAHLVVEARPDLELSLGHVRHGLRDDSADVAVVRLSADALGLPLAIEEVDVRRGGEGLEAAARDARYTALRRLAAEAGAAWILLGHTADDQAETLLLRMARGTGISGLGGMAPVRGDLVRPLLRVRRTDVRRFVTREKLDAVEDPTNLDPAISRVRVRHSVLPAFGSLAPDPVGALARLADLARVDAHHLESEADRAVRAAARAYGPARALPTETLTNLDAAIAPRVVRRLVAAVRGTPTPITAAQVSAVLGLRSGQALDVPGATVTRGGGWLAAVPHGLPEPTTVPLPVPGSIRWSPAGVTIVATVAGRDSHPDLHHPPGRRHPRSADGPEEGLPPGGDPALGQVVLGELERDDEEEPSSAVSGAGPAEEARDAGPVGLVVRSRRPGDRVVTWAGSRKLQDLFVDLGIPRAVRDLVPVVALGERLLWVPGVAVDARAAAAGGRRPAAPRASGTGRRQDDRDGTFRVLITVRRSRVGGAQDAGG